MTNKKTISLEISKEKHKLAVCVENTGLNSNETIKQSQKLDMLITKCQKLKIGEKMK
ncbi:aspartyl-phosphate phosphatase Spo0E family protein [Fictibacillus aquaticus]|nr:aspartyl-phosphate phosphatase Spo0E family protein [Fictibacillus aquaticus]